MPAPLTILLALYALTSLVTFAAYARDKRAARKNSRRTPERTLHTLELLGGFPGALIAQHTLRHKNRKLAYQLIFWLIVLAHATAWTTLILFAQPTNL